MFCNCTPIKDRWKNIYCAKACVIWTECPHLKSCDKRVLAPTQAQIKVPWISLQHSCVSQVYWHERACNRISIFKWWAVQNWKRLHAPGDKIIALTSAVILKLRVEVITIKPVYFFVSGSVSSWWKLGSITAR